MSSSLLGRLAGRITPRPWPPAPATDAGAACAATVRLLLAEYRDNPLPDLDCENWVVVAENRVADELKTELLERSLVVAAVAEWDSLTTDGRDELADLAVVQVGLAEDDWTRLIPTGGPSAAELAVHGPLQAVRSELDIASRARIHSLHVWRRSDDGPLLVPEASGALEVRARASEG